MTDALSVNVNPPFSNIISFLADKRLVMRI
jgi:hypothetical protein